jgi:AraC family transcriptional regulator of adaptative response / DNA-3-methyladenine glycosylase II
MATMLLDPAACYQALKARDARFDGRFFVGVSSTRIYCRPVCTVKTPQQKNCTFYPSAAAAEVSGYRPCLRCRPELAPGNATVDAPARLAHAAAGLIEDGLLNESGVIDIADRLGVTDRHLRRVFQAQFGVAPVEYAQTQRLLLAKRLLTDTRLNVTDVAMASGFNSVRRFNALFRSRYRLSPSDLRKRLPASASADVLTFQLGYRPPLDWQRLLGFLEKRSIDGVESVANGRYMRTIRIEQDGRTHAGWVSVAPAKRKPALEVQLSASLIGVIPAVLGRVKRLFDLTCNPDEIDAALGELAQTRPGLRLPGAFDGFEVAVRAVVGQQITVKAARTLVGRFASQFGTPIETPAAGLRTLFPSPARMAEINHSQIAEHGIIGARAKSILALAQAIDDGALALEPGADVENTIGRLREVPGVGEWTAQYIAMRALSWPDAFPHTDYGVLKAMGEKNPRQALARAAAWQPWRAYAVIHLWSSLEGPTP